MNHMKLVWILVIVLVIAGAIVAGNTVWKGDVPRAERDVVVEQFLAVLPPNLDSGRRDEIERLFQSLWSRTDHGVVDVEDADKIKRELRKHIDRGYIEEKDLAYVMAMVGHFNYKNDPNFASQDGDIDHPLLNPEAGNFQIRPDSSFWEEFEEWKQQRADSLAALGDTI